MTNSPRTSRDFSALRRPTLVGCGLLLAIYACTSGPLSPASEKFHVAKGKGGAAICYESLRANKTTAIRELFHGRQTGLPLSSLCDVADLPEVQIIAHVDDQLSLDELLCSTFGVCLTTFGGTPPLSAYEPEEATWLLWLPPGIGDAIPDSTDYETLLPTWLPEVHDALLQHAPGPFGVSQAIIDTLKWMSRDVDKKTQSDNAVHCMRSTATAPQQALKDCIDLQNTEVSLARLSTTFEAQMYHLAVAMHACMDHTSPSHTDANGFPKEWPTWGNLSILHVANEGLNSITSAVYAASDSCLTDLYSRVRGTP